jgi:hypothetical protein
MHDPAFQRLTQIRQLGLAFLVYPGAEHSRFIHALGAYHLSLQMIEAMQRQDKNLFTEAELLAIPLAALCHDIGHGPFSHLFERVTKEFVSSGSDHETWTIRILEESEISKVLEKAGVRQIITEIINPTKNYTFKTSSVNWTLIADYLCRDSL